MKKLLGLTLSLAALGVFGTSAEAKEVHSATNVAGVVAMATPQRSWERNRYNRRVYNRRVRTVTRTRVVRWGRRVYRETYIVRVFPNGRTDTRLINRVRIS